MKNRGKEAKLVRLTERFAVEPLHFESQWCTASPKRFVRGKADS